MEKLTRKKAEELMEKEGESRGVTLRTSWTYVKEEYGEEVLSKIEKRMAELGYPVKDEEIKVMDFYPVGMDALALLVIKEELDLSEEEMMKIGMEKVKFSLFFKVMLKHFIRLKVFEREGPKFWRKHYTIGELIVKVDEEKKKTVLKVENFKVHPIYCPVLRGYFLRTVQMAVGEKNVKIYEEECVFKGSDCYKFAFSWGEE